MTSQSVAKLGSLRGGVVALGLLAGGMGAAAQGMPQRTLTIDPGTVVTPVSPMLYGLMTEEINHSYDGGLYPELVQNPTFRSTWEGILQWGLVRGGTSQASISLDHASGPSKALSYSVKLEVTSASAGNAAGISNPGYWGMAMKPNTLYQGSFYARVAPGSADAMEVRIVSDHSGLTLAHATVALHEGDWSQYHFSFKTGPAPVSVDNHLELTVAKPGTVWLQLVSLLPPAYHNRPNGLRSDLMQRMADMHPHFVRLPGGNYLEGDRPEDWYNWKETIGPRVDRPGHMAPWTYWSTDGLGLLEFLEWTEDLKVEPVLAVFAGYSLHGHHYNPGKDLEPYVQAALDEVEYVTGDTSTKWGAERAKDGHPAPFPLHYIEIGNEDFFDKSGSYDERFAQFALALRKKYPQYKLIATTPVKEKPAAEPDLVDDHYYKPPYEMMDFVHHYDNAPRNGPKIFVGEWATRSGSPTPNFGDALGDAAWMTSMERNSDLIQIASYAPLLVNVSPGGMQWPTDLIGFDAKTTYVSPSYYAQALFSGHLGSGTAKSSLTGDGDRFFYSATVDPEKHVLYLKLVNATDKPQPLAVELTGIKGTHVAKVTSLHGATYQATNSMEKPDVIHPVMSTVTVAGSSWKHTVPALTIEVMDVPLK